MEKEMKYVIGSILLLAIVFFGIGWNTGSSSALDKVDDSYERFNKIQEDLNEIKYAYSNYFDSNKPKYTYTENYSNLNTITCKAKREIVLMKGDDLILNVEDCSYILNFYRTSG